MPDDKVGGARDYAGQTAAERATRRREALIDAAFDALASDGRSGVRIEGLCRAAGLNKRYFYESFAGADAVVAAVLERLAEQAAEAALAALDGADDTAAAARRAVEAFVVHLTDDPRRARVLFGAVAVGDGAAQSRAAALRSVVAVVAASGGQLYGLDADRRVDVAAAMLVGGTGQAILDFLDGRISGSRAELVDELVALWLTVAEGTIARVRGSNAR